MDRWYWDEEEMYRVDKYGSPVDSCKNMDVEWYKADEVDTRIQELEDYHKGIVEALNYEIKIRNTRIQELRDENKLLKNKDALAQVCIDIKTDNDILRKALEEIVRINANERGTEAQRKMGMIATEALRDT